MSNANPAAFINLAKHPLKFRAFLFAKLPSAFFAGLRVREMDERHCSVSVPFKWFSKNPFKSTYFACLAMAAEMSTGSLAMAHVYQRKPSVSMLVVNIYGEYHKKATGRTTFTCDDGDLFRKIIEDAIESGEAKTIKAKSTGRNAAGEVVAEFFITWSFKAKQSPR
jgi:hypothetical protein